MGKLWNHSATVPSGHQWSVSSLLPVWSSLASLQEFLRGATGRLPHGPAWPYFLLFLDQFSDPPKIVSFPSRATLDSIMNRKGFQKVPQNRASRAANFLWKSMIFGGPPPPPPQEPQSLDFRRSSDQFWTIFERFESIFIDLFQSCLHLLPQWFAMIQ